MDPLVALGPADSKQISDGPLGSDHTVWVAAALTSKGHFFQVEVRFFYFYLAPIFSLYGKHLTFNS